MNRLAGVILAGGRSSRMGSDKALLPLNGVCLIDYVANTMKTSNIQHIYVSGQMSGYRSISDTLEHKGPVGGMCSIAKAR